MKDFFLKLIKAILSVFKKPKAEPELPEPPPKVVKPIAEPPKENNHDDPSWLKAAYGELGVAEIPGAGSNPRIVEYHQSTTLDKELAQSDETPWCSSFTNFCLTQSGQKGTDSAWARSFLKWGYPMDIPRRGCIAVFTRGYDGGHVGFYIKEIDGKILVLSGNQSNKVCEAFYPKVRLIAYRWPKGRE